MRYVVPASNHAHLQPLLARQQNGTVPTGETLNPECTPGSCIGETVGGFCESLGDNEVLIEARYFLPGQDNCKAIIEDCTVRVNSQAFNCNGDLRCDEATCDRQSGLAIHCSGVMTLPSGCKGVDIDVVCTSESDSDDCGSLDA